MANEMEGIKARKNGLDVLPDIHRYAQLGFAAIDPEDYQRMKWYGLFHRKTTPGFFMMRLRAPNGILSSTQMAGLGHLANRYCRGQADLTTRQNLQLRWVRIEDVPRIFELLAGLGIEHRQTGSDNVRNITGCPIAGLDPEEVLDASPVARAIQDAIVGIREFSNLPRKFNISISGCRHDCALSQTHDVGLTPARKTLEGVDRVGFNLRMGGAMGGKSTHLAWDPDVFVAPEDVPRLCQTILEIFRDHGSRESRLRARMRWLVEAWGVEKFRGEIEARWGAPLPRSGEDLVTEYGGDHIGVRRQKQDGLSYVGFNVPVGRITGDDLIEFARLADRYGSGEVRLTHDQNVIVVNVPVGSVAALLEEPLAGRFSPHPAGSFRRLVSCTGNDFCHYSLIDTKARATQVATQLASALPADTRLRMHWSGCPHACGLHPVADVGIQAARVRVDGQVVDAADVYLGGRLGKDPRLAQKVLSGVPIRELADRVVDLLRTYDRDARPPPTETAP